jgi:hypothetical protein
MKIPATENAKNHPRRFPYSDLIAALVLLTWPFCVPHVVLAQNITWSGRFKTLNIHLEPAPKAWSAGGELSLNSLRLGMQADLPRSLRFESAVESILLATNPSDLAALTEKSRQRAVDLTESWGEGHSLKGQLQVDRLHLSGRTAHLEWDAGRQAIGFGRILLASPLDVIAPFAPDAVDTEIRPGVDALKLLYYFGSTGELGAYAILSDESDDCSALMTLSWNTHGVDILGITGTLRNRPMGGIGLAGDLGGVGLKAEIAVYGGKDVSNPGGDLHRFFAIAALECWYRFDNGLVLPCQYLYNGAGADKPGEYARAMTSAPIREGLSYLLGHHYLLLAPSYEIHPLIDLSGLILCNLQDLSCLLRPEVNISLSDNLDLMVFWTFNLGRSPKSRVLARSEFGTRGDGGGVFLTWHF